MRPIPHPGERQRAGEAVPECKERQSQLPLVSVIFGQLEPQFSCLLHGNNMGLFIVKESKMFS